MTKIKTILCFFILSALCLSFIHMGEWVPFEGKDYTILFPKTPSSETQTVNSAIGPLQMDIHQYEVPQGTLDSNLLYGFIESEYPDSLINSDKKDILEKFFRGSIDGAVSNVHGKLLSEKVIRIDGFPGREARIDYTQGGAVITLRAYLVKNKNYILQVITESKKASNRSIAKFMNSFKLKHDAELKPAK